MDDAFNSYLRSQIQMLKERVNGLQSEAEGFKRTLTEDLIEALIKRFERNERAIGELNKKLDEMGLRVQEQMYQMAQKLEKMDVLKRREASEAKLKEAISRLAGEAEIKISKQALQKLREF
jgi:hypothetical protein